MTVFLICMIPLAGLFGFLLCALLQVASAADRQEEKLINAMNCDPENKEDA